MPEIYFNNDEAIIIIPKVHIVPKQEALEIFKEIKALDAKPCQASNYMHGSCDNCPLWSLVEKTSYQISCVEVFKIIKSMEF